MLYTNISNQMALHMVFAATPPTRFSCGLSPLHAILSHQVHQAPGTKLEPKRPWVAIVSNPLGTALMLTLTWYFFSFAWSPFNLRLVLPALDTSDSKEQLPLLVLGYKKTLSDGVFLISTINRGIHHQIAKHFLGKHFARLVGYRLIYLRAKSRCLK